MKEEKDLKDGCFGGMFFVKIKFILIFFSIVFFALFLMLAFYRFSIFLILLPFVVILYSFGFSVLIEFLQKKDLIIKQLFFDFKLVENKDFEKFPVPIMICSKDGTIYWCNENFKKNIKKNFVGDKIEDVFKKTKKNIFFEKESYVELEDKKFKTYVSFLEFSEMYLIYFEDITDFLFLEEEFKFSKPCVFYVVVDNYKEVLADRKDSEKSVLIGKIDNLIEEFVDSYMGFMQKYRENEFLIILEVRHLKNICKNKFSILQSVREIMGDENFCLTLSIGVGAFANSLSECAKFAIEALDMALGRGGDQAAVKTPSSFEFYGGTSKGVEKNTRVRARVIARAMLKLINDSKNVIIMGHKFADLDSVASSIGLASTIKKMNKSCYIVIDRLKNLADVLIERFKDSDIYSLIVEEETAVKLLDFNTLLIVVDTHNPKFLESYDLYENCRNVIVIDHHRKMVDAINDAVIFYHEPHASSTSELVCELIQYFGEKYKLKALEAEALLSGIMLDTKNFTIKVGVRTFEAAAYLKRLGADTVAVRKLFSSSLELYEKRTQLVVSAKIYRNCAISMTELTTKDLRIICPQAADELLKIVGIEASFVIYSLDDVVNITARSLGFCYLFFR